MAHHVNLFSTEPVWNVLLVSASLFYILAAIVSNRKPNRKPWPLSRLAAFFTGLLCTGAAVTGPLAERAHTDFPAHMWGHLLLGMTAPLFLAAAQPVALALRTLPVKKARMLTRFLNGRYVKWISDPFTASVLNVGGLWVLYATPLYGLMHQRPSLHLLIHIHMLLAGFLFTISILHLEPVSHRTSFRYRALILLAALSAHNILSKYIYAHPPSGVPAGEAQLGGMMMYYGGDAVDAVLIFIFCYQWYRSVRPGSAAAVRTDNESGVTRN